MSAEQNRRIENLIRFGVIAEVDHTQRKARAQSGEILTDWLPWVAFRAGTTKIWSPVTVGEQCLILAPSGELTTAAILTGIYTLEFNTPSNSPDEHVIEFADGASVAYNQANSAMTISGVSTALLSAKTSVTLETPLVKCTQDLEVVQHIKVGGNLQMTGSAGAGNAEMSGKLTTKGDVIAGEISLQNHTHQGDSGGRTGKPR